MVTADDEERFVRYYAKRLALMCEVALQMPVGVQVRSNVGASRSCAPLTQLLAIREPWLGRRPPQATAVTYLKRFYLVHSVLEYHPKKIL